MVRTAQGDSRKEFKGAIHGKDRNKEGLRGES